MLQADTFFLSKLQGHLSRFEENYYHRNGAGISAHMCEGGPGVSCRSFAPSRIMHDVTVLWHMLMLIIEGHKSLNCRLSHRVKYRYVFHKGY